MTASGSLPLAVDRGGGFLVLTETSMIPLSLAGIRLRRVLAGNEDAWQELVGQTAGYMLAAIHRLTPDEDEKMTIFTTVLEKLRERDFAKLRSFRGRSSLTTWLTVVARNVALDWLRSKYGRDFRGKKVVVVSIDQEPALVNRLSAGSDPAVVLRGERRERAGAELLGHVVRALADLPETERLLVRLVFFQGLKIGQAGEVLGIPRVYKVLERVLRRLRSVLAAAGVTAERFADFFGETT
ncbi:MAG TPA: RNA polymerase sigma factor [Candidatus Aminicenantes bacterium]|nr:RNA polymerase sigma factor [Candidatus Aminicenantes bacterium]